MKQSKPERQKDKKSIIKTIFSITIIITVVISMFEFYLPHNKMIINNNIRQEKGSSTLSIGGIMKEYIVDINKFGIKDNNASPIETSKGINQALKYAKEKGYGKVVLPKGEYLISETDPIIIVDNIVLDLNESILRININDLQRYTLINFTGCKNAKLINGTLLGDKDTHDYKTNPGSHEWDTGIIFNDSENCELNNVIVKSFPGYGISSSLGKNLSNLAIGVTKDNLKIGCISDKGILNNTKGTIRTIKPMDISKVGKEFELGYNKGYMGYPFINSKVYDSYFYDKDMKFISESNDCIQYKKVTLPKGAVYVNFVFHQSAVPTKGDTDFNSTTVFLTNYTSPYKIKITNCIIEDNNSLGIGLCGGRDFTIENNTFKNNGGSAPGFAIDMEDGWEYMDGFLFKGNKFINNSNDVVICAGDSISFEDNSFTSTVYMWGRATNYKFQNNEFTNISGNINYEYSSDTVITGNTYTNSKVAITAKNNTSKIKIDNEKLINSSINAMSDNAKLESSSIISDSSTSIRLAGAYKNCSINSKKGDFISAKLYSCKLKDTDLNPQGNTTFDDCDFTNSNINTTSQTKLIKITNSKLVDSSFTVNTWGSAAAIDMENNYINMYSGKNSFINISAGKIDSLVFNYNKVNNQTERPVFNMYDTGYSVPDGRAVIHNNSFILSRYNYVFDGANITSGTFELSNRNNKIQGAKFLSDKYINNNNFIQLNN